MKSTLLFFSFLLSSFTCIFAQNIEDWQGAWKGELDLGMSTLPLVLHLEHKDGLWKGELDSPTQGAFGIAADKVEIKGDKVFVEIKLIVGVFEGSYKDGAINGTWTQGQTLKLNLKKIDLSTQEKKVQIVQEYPLKPYPYIEEEVKFQNKKDKITLAGTLTYPNNKDKFPVAILIAGSGAQNRDGELFNHRPFLLIADYLTRNGIAVLRIDERGVGASTGTQSTATTANFVKDFEAAVAFLKKHKRINKKQIGLIGHSEGGIIAPMIASQDKSIAFVVLLAAPGVPCREILAAQFSMAMENTLGKEKSEELGLFMKKLYDQIALDKENKKIAADFKNLLLTDFQQLDNNIKSALQLDENSLELLINNIIAPAWMRYFIKIEPKTYLEKLTCPTYVLQGGKDIQVLAEPNMEAIQNALEKAKNPNFSVQLYSPLNHLFQTCDYCTVGEYATLKEAFSQDVMEDIAIWLKYNIIANKK